jgi:hypothetical protein
MEERIDKDFSAVDHNGSSAQTSLTLKPKRNISTKRYSGDMYLKGLIMQWFGMLLRASSLKGCLNLN